jgi:uncharacterized protein
MLKAICDTNVIVSGLIAHSGGPYELLEAWRRSEFVLLVSEAIVSEVTEVLARPFFRDKRGITQKDIVRIKAVLGTDAVMVAPQSRLKVIENDPDDDRILECALDGEADYLVSGDHHLLALQRYRGIPVVTTRQFLMVLQETRPAK